MTNINWNGDAASAPFKSRFDEASENLILAEDQNGDVALFEWDGTTWQFRGPVEMNGEDVSGIGALTATSGTFDSVTTEEVNSIQFAGERGSDEQAVQNALDAVDSAGGGLVVMDDVGGYDVADDIRLYDNCHILILDDIDASGGENYAVFSNDDSDGNENISIVQLNGQITGEGKEGDVEFAVEFRAVKNAEIRGLDASEFSIDGCYLSENSDETENCENVLVENCIFNDSDRWGLAITGGDNIAIRDSTFNGNDYGSIDIENHNTDVSNITVDNCEGDALLQAYAINDVGKVKFTNNDFQRIRLTEDGGGSFTELPTVTGNTYDDISFEDVYPIVSETGMVKTVQISNSVVDYDDSTAFTADFDPPDLPDVSRYIVRGHVHNQVDADNELRCSLNGIDSDGNESYNYINQAGTTLSEREDEDDIRLFTIHRFQSSSSFDFYINSPPETEGPRSEGLVYNLDVTYRSGTNKMTNGNLQDDSELSEVSIESDDDAIGGAVLLAEIIEEPYDGEW